MNACGIEVAETPSVMGETLIKVLKEKAYLKRAKRTDRSRGSRNGCSCFAEKEEVSRFGSSIALFNGLQY